MTGINDRSFEVQNSDPRGMPEHPKFPPDADFSRFRSLRSTLKVGDFALVPTKQTTPWRVGHWVLPCTVDEAFTALFDFETRERLPFYQSVAREIEVTERWGADSFACRWVNDIKIHSATYLMVWQCDREAGIADFWLDQRHSHLLERMDGRFRFWKDEEGVFVQFAIHVIPPPRAPRRMGSVAGAIAIRNEFRYLARCCRDRSNRR